MEVPEDLSIVAVQLQIAQVSLTSSRYVMLFDKGVLQPRSQGLSSLPPLVVGRKTLVAAGHVTTQNLGGKKICWIGGVAEYFVS